MAVSRLLAALVCVLALVAASCSDDGDVAPTAGAEAAEPTVTEASPDADAQPSPDGQPEPDDPDEEEPSEPDDPEFVELTYFEGTERATFVLEGGDDRCEDVDEQTRRCEADLGFDSVATHLGRAGGESVVEMTSHAAACPTSERPGTRMDLDGTITTGLGDEVFFVARTNCAPYPGYWIVTGGTGRFEDASGVMSNAATDHPAYLSFATGQLSVRADRWADVLPPAPATEPDPGVEFLDIAYFEGIFSATSTTASAGDCDRSDPDVVVCTSSGSGELKATLLGNATNTWTATTTQLADSSCELDGSAVAPTVIDGTGTITSQRGDELSYVSRTHVDPCATEGSGTGGTTSYWRVTGGTGQFADAHGLISGVATPGLGFEAIGAGTLSVRADQWPQLAAEYATLPTGDDYIELRYWERFLLPPAGVVGMQIEPPQDCDITDPGAETCDYRLTGTLTGTHIGAASEVQTGTITRRLDDTCPTGGTPSLRQGSGVITTPWGDDLQFRTRADSCEIAFWVLDGGTGRFDGARGVMTGLGAFEMGDDTALIQSGTFHLRADLWTDLLPTQD